MNLSETLPGGFAATELSPALLTIVTKAGLVTPTPIQEQAIPVALKGSDLIGVAQTGTGKTLAFSLPLLERLKQTNGRGLILVPTRELALQVDEVICRISRSMNPSMPTAVLIGGMSMRLQVAALRRNPRIIIATPGRLRDLMDQGLVNLNRVTNLILDEADRMLDMGFIAQIRYIIQAVPAERQTMLFSATMSPEVTKLAQEYMREPVRIEVAKSGTAAAEVEQQLCYVQSDRKPEVLDVLLRQYAGSVLVFSRTKHGAAKLSHKLSVAGHQAAEIHSDRSLGQRRQALDGFKSGRYRVLVATDIAARGIDVHDIELVVNYDLPDAPEDYVHRIGRTGRAGKAGLAISLAGHDQYGDVRSIERLMNLSLPLSEHSEAKQAQPAPVYKSTSRPRPRGQGPSNRNSRSSGSLSNGGNSWRRY